MKISILVGGVTNKGGVERVVLLMAKKFKANIITWKYIPERTFTEFKSCDINQLQQFMLPQRFGSLLSRVRFKFVKPDADVNIYQGGHCIAAAKNNKRNIWYAHAATRWLYGQYHEELAKFKGIKKILFRIFATVLRNDDQKNVKSIDLILTNSIFTQQRIKKYYGRDSKVVYPPVETNKFTYNKTGDFYLSSQRLDPVKRVKLVVKAFMQMPDKKLVVSSGGIEYESIKKMTIGYPNISVLGWVSDEKLKDLYGNCIATFSMGYKEDFGMVVPESMSAGKPSIASNEGGHRETVLQKKTGLLINATVKEIINAVKWLDAIKAKKMRTACEKRAVLYSNDRFNKQIKSAIDQLMNS